MKALIYSKDTCPNCIEALALLRSYKADIMLYKIVDIIPEDNKDYPYIEQIKPYLQFITQEQFLKQVPTAKSVPQIFIDDEYVGGLSDLKNYLAIEK